MSEERWVSVAKIVELLDVHEETVRAWLRKGDLRGIQFGGKTGWRVRESDLNAFLEEKLQAPKLAA